MAAKSKRKQLEIEEQARLRVDWELSRWHPLLMHALGYNDLHVQARHRQGTNRAQTENNQGSRCPPGT